MTHDDPAISAGPDPEVLEALLDVTYSWSYEETREELRALYRRAQRQQWIPDRVIDFSSDVDPERPSFPQGMHPIGGSVYYEKLTERERLRLNAEMMSWTLSQFLHGEQGALMATSQIVSAAGDMDSKLYAGTQVVDEARHVEVFSRYLLEKVGSVYPVNPHLKELLDLIIKDSRWDMKCLGMQVMVEGLALAAFGFIRHNSDEQLLVDVTRYVIADEARHVAFGVLSLRDHYREMSEADVREREDFVFEAARLMRDRFLMFEVWETMGMPADECAEVVLHNPAHIMFRQLLFSKIVPAVKKIGLLSDRQRERFQELGILQFENAADPFEELETEQQDAVA